MAAVRATMLQLAVLARDEMRVVLRSSRGRFAAAAYCLLNLTPLGLLLWSRNRYNMPWPVDAADVSTYLTGVRLVDLALVVALAHDVLTRGDREGWQDGVASLPIHELVWLVGRLFGRAAAVAAIMLIPWFLGWSAASAWAGSPLDPVPFVACILGSSALSLALLLPLAVAAGAMGNSMVGAGVFIVTGLSLAQMLIGRAAKVVGISGLDLWTLLIGGGGYLVNRVSLLAETVLTRQTSDVNIFFWVMRFASDAGRRWPPWLDGPDQLLRFGLVPLVWLTFLAAVPFMLRLRRRAGRWLPRVARLPTFSRWLSELVDQTRPTAPESPATRWFAGGALTVLLASLAALTVLAVQIGGEQRSLAAPRVALTSDCRWPTRLVPEQRSLELTIARSGELSGQVRYRGLVEGRTDRDLPFALAPGMTVTGVLDAEGLPLAWWRDPETLWVRPGATGPALLELHFAGRPLELNSSVSTRVHRRGAWRLSAPPREHLSSATRRRWLVDLRRVSWAPQPVAAPVRGRLAECWGTTTLLLRCPQRLAPVPLPGQWQEASTDGVITARWQGVSPLLPPVVAGRVQRRSRSRVRMVACSPATDLEGMLDEWQRSWDGAAELAEAVPVVLSFVPSARATTVRRPWSAVHALEPPIRLPAGMLELDPERESRAGMVRAGLVTFDSEVQEVRARCRFAGLAPRVARDQDGPVRWCLWRLCRLLERWPPPRDVLVLTGVHESWFRTADLRARQDPGRLAPHQVKLDSVLTALVHALGVEQVEAGMRRLAAGHGPLDLEAVWLELAGSRAGELQWFHDEVLLGTGLPSPRLESVTAQAQGRRWLLRVRLANPGDAATVVPLRLIGQGESKLLRVPLAAGETVLVEERLHWAVDQVLLDPEGQIVRQQIGAGQSWSRWAGVQ